MSELSRSATSGQTYSRWFTVWPTTHVNEGKTVEVMPVAEHDAAMGQLWDDWEAAYRKALAELGAIESPPQPGDRDA